MDVLSEETDQEPAGLTRSELQVGVQRLGVLMMTGRNPTACVASHHGLSRRLTFAVVVVCCLVVVLSRWRCRRTLGWT
jgi:hypothetical protein